MYIYIYIDNVRKQKTAYIFLVWLILLFLFCEWSTCLYTINVKITINVFLKSSKHYTFFFFWELKALFTTWFIHPVMPTSLQSNTRSHTHTLMDALGATLDSVACPQTFWLVDDKFYVEVSHQCRIENPGNLFSIIRNAGSHLLTSAWVLKGKLQSSREFASY